MLYDRPTRTEIADLLAQAATRPPRRGRRRVGLVAALACVVILVAGGATSVWASGRGAAELSWGEAMVVLRASELGSRRRAALEAIRRHTREAIIAIREIETGDDGLREHADSGLWYSLGAGIDVRGNQTTDWFLGFVYEHSEFSDLDAQTDVYGALIGARIRF